MNKRVALVSLAVTCGLVASLHLSWVEHDNGHLLQVDGNPIDLMGEIGEQWNRITRQCHHVRRVSSGESVHAQALAAIAGYSPPHSASAQLVSLWTRGEWLLAEVEFQELFPAVVLIHQSPHLTIVPHAVWSGVTKPWKAAPHIRHYLSEKASGVPSDLFRCFDPQSRAF